jgi:short-subunit dehydrogenase
MAKAIRDQVIVITGASSGIGRITAMMAAAEGARVVLAARNETNLEEVAREIHRAGGAARAVPTDVTDIDQVRRLAQAAMDEFGRVDTWVNNAAVSLYGTFDDTAVEDIRRVIDVNFMGQVNCAKVALPLLEESAGTLVCVGSVLSDVAVPLQGAYVASKHALKGWIDGLRIELRKKRSHVRVTLVKPSSMNTPLFDKARTSLGVMPRPIPPVYEPELVARAILRAAKGRERDIYVGTAGKLYSVLARVSPRAVEVHQRLTGFKGQRTDWPKPEESPNNLYEPVADDGGGHGDFTSEAKPRSVFDYVDRHSKAFWAGVLVAAGAVAWARMRSRSDGALESRPRSAAAQRHVWQL